MCFSLAYIEHAIITLIIIGAIFAIIKLLIPAVLGFFGGAGGIAARAIEIFLWAVILIFVVIFIFDLASCLLGMGGGFSLMPRR